MRAGMGSIARRAGDGDGQIRSVAVRRGHDEGASKRLGLTSMLVQPLADGLLVLPVVRV